MLFGNTNLFLWTIRGGTQLKKYKCTEYNSELGIRLPLIPLVLKSGKLFDLGTSANTTIPSCFLRRVKETTVFRQDCSYPSLYAHHQV